MNVKDELGALTIRNCAVVFQSFNLLEEIGDKLITVFNARMPKLVEKIFPGWHSYNHLGTETGMSFLPPEWYFTDYMNAYFEFQELDNNIKLYNNKKLGDFKFWLNLLTGQYGEMVIAFLFNPKLFGERDSEAKRLKQKFYFDNEEKLRKHNFFQKIAKDIKDIVMKKNP